MGKDTLTGGGGADTFLYQSPNQGGDTITAFAQNDILAISASGFGGGLRKNTALSKTAAKTGTIVSGAVPVPLGSANFLYNNRTGFLSFDVDGSGLHAPVNVTTLSRAPSLGLNRFAIVT